MNGSFRLTDYGLPDTTASHHDIDYALVVPALWRIGEDRKFMIKATVELSRKTSAP
jgi:hypothetical protein